MIRVGMVLGTIALLGVQIASAQNGVDNRREKMGCTYEFAGEQSENRAPRLVRDCSRAAFDVFAEPRQPAWRLKDTEKGE